MSDSKILVEIKQLNKIKTSSGAKQVRDKKDAKIVKQKEALAREEIRRAKAVSKGENRDVARAKNAILNRHRAELKQQQLIRSQANKRYQVLKKQETGIARIRANGIKAMDKMGVDPKYEHQLMKEGFKTNGQAFKDKLREFNLNKKQNLETIKANKLSTAETAKAAKIRQRSQQELVRRGIDPNSEIGRIMTEKNVQSEGQSFKNSKADFMWAKRTEKLKAKGRRDLISAGLDPKKNSAILEANIKNNGMLTQQMKEQALYSKHVQGNTTRMAMNFLSVMFIGQAITKMFKGLYQRATASFNELTKGTDGANKGLTMLQANIKFVQFSLGNALSEALMPYMDTITYVAETVSDFFSKNPKLTLKAVFGGIALGTLMSIVGQVVLFVASMRNIATMTSLARKVKTFIDAINGVDTTKTAALSNLGTSLATWATRGLGIGLTIFAGIKSVKAFKQGDILKGIVYGIAGLMGAGAVVASFTGASLTAFTLPIIVSALVFIGSYKLGEKIGSNWWLKRDIKKRILASGDNNLILEMNGKVKLNKDDSSVNRMIQAVTAQYIKAQDELDKAKEKYLGGEMDFTQYSTVQTKSKNIMDASQAYFSGTKLEDEYNAYLQQQLDDRDIIKQKAALETQRRKEAELLVNAKKEQLNYEQEIQAQTLEDTTTQAATYAQQNVQTVVTQKQLQGETVSADDIAQIASEQQAALAVAFDVTFPIKTAFENASNNEELALAAQGTGLTTMQSFNTGFNEGSAEFKTTVNDLANNVLSTNFGGALDTVNTYLDKQKILLQSRTDDMKDYAEKTNDAARAIERLNEAHNNKKGLVEKIEDFF